MTDDHKTTRKTVQKKFFLMVNQTALSFITFENPSFEGLLNGFSFSSVTVELSHRLVNTTSQISHICSHRFGKLFH